MLRKGAYIAPLLFLALIQKLNQKNSLPKAQWHYYFVYFSPSFVLRRMLYITNRIERLNKEIKLRGTSIAFPIKIEL